MAGSRLDKATHELSSGSAGMLTTVFDPMQAQVIDPHFQTVLCRGSRAAGSR